MRTSVVRRCAPAFPSIRWRGNVFRPHRPVRPWHTGRSGRDASDPPRRELGTGSRPGVVAHTLPPPPGSLADQQSLTGRPYSPLPGLGCDRPPNPWATESTIGAQNEM